MVSLSIDGSEFIAGSLSLRISLGRGPVCRVRMYGDLHPPARASYGEWVARRAEATLQQEGAEQLTLLTMGFDETHDGTPRVVDLVGLRCPPTTYEWFAGAPGDSDGLESIFYQRRPKVEEKDFLSSLFGAQLGSPWPDGLTGAFPEWSSVARPGGYDNYAFIEEVSRFLRLRSETILGWLFVGAEEAPLRLAVTGAEKPLDAQWLVQSPVFPRDRLIGGGDTVRLKRSFDLNEGKALEFLSALSDSGREDAEEKIQASVAADARQVFFLPGLAKWHDQKYVCEAIEYEVDFVHPNFATATIELTQYRTVDPRESYSALSAFHIGEFEQWFDDSPEDDSPEIALLTPGDESWGVMNSSGEAVDANVQLGCHLLMPTSVRDTAQGMYVLHTQGDKKVLNLYQGRVPFVDGGIQRKNEEMESSNANMILNGEKLVLSSSPRDAKVDECNGMRIDGTKVFVEGVETKIMDEVLVKEDEITLEAKTNVKGELHVSK